MIWIQVAKSSGPENKKRLCIENDSLGQRERLTGISKNWGNNLEFPFKPECIWEFSYKIYSTWIDFKDLGTTGDRVPFSPICFLWSPATWGSSFRKSSFWLPFPLSLVFLEKISLQGNITSLSSYDSNFIVFKCMDWSQTSWGPILAAPFTNYVTFPLSPHTIPYFTPL